MANITGMKTRVQRVETGFWSLDKALSGDGVLGIPMTFIEMFGFQGVGKTTLVSSLMAIIANHYQKKVVYAPFEHVDLGLMEKILDNQKCEQEVALLGNMAMVKKFFPSMKTQKVTDELMLDCFIAAAHEDTFCVGVVDSLSAIVTIAEAESSVAERNMGRARVVSAFSRSIVQAMRLRDADNIPFCTFVLTHKTAPMGGGTPTNTGAPTTGGEVKKNISKVRIVIRRISEPAFSMDSKKNIYENHVYFLDGKVEKNNFGTPGKSFVVAMLGGKGAHVGLTAMYECKKLGICSFGKSITLGETKYGTILSSIEHAYAGDDEFFQPFIDALKNPSAIGKAEIEDDENWEEGEE